MKESATNVKDSVRENTSDSSNRRFDQKVIDQVYKYRSLSAAQISDRLEQLDREWDLERMLEVTSSSLALAGLVFGAFGKKRWFFLPAIVGGFLLQHGVQRWSPPIAIFRRLGYRTRQEIDEEIYAMKVLRGDLDTISSESAPLEILGSFRR